MPAAKTLRASATDVREGDLVTSLSHGSLGIGRLIRRGATSTVEFMRAPGESETISVPLRDLRRAEPAVNARAFWHVGDQWCYGRVESVLPGCYRVRASDGSAVTVGEGDLFIRGDAHGFDPASYIRNLIVDPVRSYRVRRAWVDAWLAQGEATAGLDGILSSAVNLHRHQLLVVTRVLHDPIQRYLLADEVGLGKTIEAGIILRQYLVEEPDGGAIVLAPAALCEQWEEELQTKLLIDDFPDARVDVIDVASVKAYSDLTGTGLLIVDEVHRIAENPSREPFESVRNLAHGTERLLLLSATPILQNEQAFLAMLHLLDPENYRLDDVQAFRDLLERRTELGLLFYTFTASQPNFQIRGQLSQLREWFPGDATLGILVDTAVPLAREDADGDLNARASAIHAIRVHLSERYRVHSRLLRTRRAQLAKTEDLTRGRREPHTVELGDDLRLPVLEHVDAWREALHQAAFGRDDTLPRQVLSSVISRAGSAFWLLGALARYRLNGDDHDRKCAGLGMVAGERFRQLPIEVGERDVLESLVDLLRPYREPTLDEPRIEALVALSEELDARAKTVAFSSFPDVAATQAHALTRRHGPEGVAYFGRAADLSVARTDLLRFREDPACRLLVCDGLAGEGVNLQFADTLLHVDLPILPNVLEQRVGRLDRYGIGGPIESWVLRDGHDLSLPDAWLTWLQEGFAVFHNSIASLQFLTQAATREALDTVLAEGAPGLRDLAGRLPERLRADLEEIEERESLDAIEAVDQDATRVDRLLVADADWRDLLTAADGVRTEYGLGRDRLRYNSGCSRYTVTHDQGSENSQRCDAQRLERHFGGSLDVVGTFARSEAVAHPGTRIRRLGERFIDRLAELTDIDDLGRCFAIWLPTPAADVNERLVLQCDLRIAPGQTSMPVRRAARRYLSEHHLTLHVDLQSGSPLQDEPLRALLEAPPPHVSDVDLHLCGEEWPLTHLIRREDWEGACDAAVAGAVAAATTHPRVVEWVRDALRDVDADMQLATLERAARAGTSPPDTVLGEARAAIGRAAPRLDACGVILLAARPPAAAET